MLFPSLCSEHHQYPGSGCSVDLREGRVKVTRTASAARIRNKPLVVEATGLWGLLVAAT